MKVLLNYQHLTGLQNIPVKFNAESLGLLVVMKVNFLLLFLAIATLGSCNDEPDYPPLSPVPSIAFRSIDFRLVEGISNPDTLSISFTFQDGDANLGLDDNDIQEPFHPFNYYTTLGERMTELDTNQFDYLKIGDNDTLPEYPSCNFKIYNQDTIYIQHNRYYNNIRFDIYIESNGNFTKFNFEEFDSCFGLETRFPRINQSGLVTKGHWFIINSNMYKGTMEYKVNGLWNYRFGNSRLKIRLNINDRSLNESNWIETPVFTLEELSNN